MPMYQEVTLPEGTAGHLYLAGMPGRYGGFEAEREEIAGAGIDTVLCLTPQDEIEIKSPEYAEAIQAGQLPWRQWMLPMADFGVPDDWEHYLKEVKAAADHLHGGGSLLIHCAAGIGRTGTTATCVLMALGLRREAAFSMVAGAGSEPEDQQQLELIHWAAHRLGQE